MEPAGANEHGGGGYHLGSSPEELERLNRQGEVLAAPPRMILQAAGIGSGMRVLDLGTGTGDVAFVAADLVGPAGEVVGIDRSQHALSLAGARSRQRGLATVRFVLGDIHEPAPGGPFDAIVARLVLMYVPEPATVLRVQSELLRPGGVVAPIEFDVRTARSMPPTPLVGQALAWLAGAFERGGIEPSMGPRLWTILEDAGLRPMGMMGIQPCFGPGDPSGPALLAGIVRTALPLIERTGVATAREVGVETLLARLSEELIGAGAVFAHPVLLSAWGTTR